MRWAVGDRVVVGKAWVAVRVRGKSGTVVEILDRPLFPVLVDLDNSIVGRAAFAEAELEQETGR